MFWRAIGITIAVAVTIVGCANSRSGIQSQDDAEQATDAENSIPDGPGAIEEQVSESDSRRIAGCRKEAPIGSRVKELSCVPAEDDRPMLPLINSR